MIINEETIERCPGCDQPVVIDLVVQGDAVKDRSTDEYWCAPCRADAEMDRRCP